MPCGVEGCPAPAEATATLRGMTGEKSGTPRVSEAFVRFAAAMLTDFGGGGGSGEGWNATGWPYTKRNCLLESFAFWVITLTGPGTSSSCLSPIRTYSVGVAGVVPATGCTYALNAGMESRAVDVVRFTTDGSCCGTPDWVGAVENT